MTTICLRASSRRLSTIVSLFIIVLVVFFFVYRISSNNTYHVDVSKYDSTFALKNKRTCQVNCKQTRKLKCVSKTRSSEANQLLHSYQTLVNFSPYITQNNENNYKIDLYSLKYANIFGRNYTIDEIKSETQLLNEAAFYSEAKLQPWFTQVAGWLKLDDSNAKDLYLEHWVQISDAIEKFDKPNNEEKFVGGIYTPPYTYYGDQGIAQLLEKYVEFLDGARGTVIGSERPWIEAHLIDAKVAQIVTSEYTDYSAGFTLPSRLQYTHPDKLAQLAPFDFAVSFSSIEHSGLGRYQDPFNFVGDLVEMAAISCVVKPGGLLFLGIPTGGDMQYGNWLRMYGPKRLTLLFDCWKLIDIQGTMDFGEMPWTWTWFTPFGVLYNQPWFVLQNVGGCSK